jgi:2'-5' RNA ligase
MIRAFIAIELSPEAKKALSELQAEFIKTDADVKWVKPENIHVTLKFLGDITEEQKIAIQNILDDYFKETQSFKIRLQTTGAFPKPEYPKVIWVGSSGETELKNIAKIVDEKINKLGFPREERAFKSHLTLGRVRSGRDKDKLLQALKKFQDWQGPEMTVAGVSLFQSTLTPQGSIYSPLHKTNFKTS